MSSNNHILITGYTRTSVTSHDSPLIFELDYNGYLIWYQDLTSNFSVSNFVGGKTSAITSYIDINNNNQYLLSGTFEDGSKKTVWLAQMSQPNGSFPGLTWVDQSSFY